MINSLEVKNGDGDHTEFTAFINAVKPEEALNDNTVKLAASAFNEAFDSKRIRKVDKSDTSALVNAMDTSFTSALTIVGDLIPEAEYYSKINKLLADYGFLADPSQLDYTLIGWRQTGDNTIEVTCKPHLFLTLLRRKRLNKSCFK